ncbi:MAG TPA: sigma-70 family RNA polymerase sigma factor [Planctomycetota bacterium]|nr:sigma-70 family RNA polymerase sigma factor [Planctomycetota bacterium]
MREPDFLKLLMEHRAMLHSFIYAITRDAHTTEDVLQEVSVVLWSKFSEFEAGTNFGAWSRSVAYREILAARRSEWRARRHFDDSCAQAILAAYERRSEQGEPSSHREALRSCLASIGGDLRTVIHCRYGLRMNSRDIARKLARTAQAVDALIYRGKKLLSACVRGRLEGEGQSG